MTTTKPRRSRPAESSAPEYTPKAMLGLTDWHLDPVARRFLGASPSARAKLTHKTFSEAFLYDGANGGAIILQTPDRRVLALDYIDPDELDANWRETLRHYAGVV